MVIKPDVQSHFGGCEVSSTMFKLLTVETLELPSRESEFAPLMLFLTRKSVISCLRNSNTKPVHTLIQTSNLFCF